MLDQYTPAVYALPDNQLDSESAAAEYATVENMVQGLARLLDHVGRHAKFFRVMLGKNGDPAFADKIRQHIQRRLRRSLPAALLSDENSTDLYLSYVSSGAVGALSWWLEHGMAYSPEQLSTILSRLIVATLPTRAGFQTFK